MGQQISPYDVLTSSGKYLDREQSNECTTAVRINAADTADRVSRLLDLLGLTASVSSGFRTPSANRSAKGATKSAHLTGEALDLEDKSGALAAAILSNSNLLVSCNLYMEDPDHTHGWVHLQTRKTASGKRVFIP